MMPRKQELQPCSFTENCSLEMSGELIGGKGAMYLSGTIESLNIRQM